MKTIEMGCPDIENAIYNWYLGGNDADPYPLLNAIATMANDEMEVLLPVEKLDSLGELSDILSEEEEFLHLSVQLLVDEEDESKYWIPVFTGNCPEENEAFPMPLGTVLNNALDWPGCQGIALNPWDNDLHMKRDFIETVLSHKPMSHMTLTRIAPDLLRTDVCVNFSSGETGSGLAVTSTERQGVLFDITAVIPEYTGKESDFYLLSKAYKNCFDWAASHNCKTITLPYIEGYPAEKTIRTATIATVNWFINHKDYVLDIYLAYNDGEYYRTCSDYFNSETRIPQSVMDFEMAHDAYSNGEFEQALILYSAAAVRGNIAAISNLGNCYYQGKGTEVDKEKAIECWQMAAEAEDINALIMLSDMYEKGEIATDKRKAFDLLIKAYKLAKVDKDTFSYPDICLRLARNYKSVLDKKKYIYLLNEAIKYFRLRSSKEESVTDMSLKEAEQMKENIL